LDADLLPAEGNEAIARGYDAVPYSPNAAKIVGPDKVGALAALFGCRESLRDVLDLGCGRGAQLELAAGQTAGRLVGADLSASACEAARERLAPVADRVQILCEDLLTLTPERLGEFDLVYSLGVISFVPAPVRAQVLRLIGACLRPGGVAVLSYYTGAKPLLRASLGRILAAATNSDAPPAERVRQARALLSQVQTGLASDESAHGLQLSAVRHAAALDDVMFFHEMLNRESTSLEATDLERQFGARGLGFLGYHKASPFMGLPTSQERAFAVDMAALTAGGYAYALFGKGDGAKGAADPRTPYLAWSTTLRRGASSAGGPPGPVVYEDRESGLSATIEFPVTQALLDAIAERPLTWREAEDRARRRVLETTGRPAAATEAQLAQNLTTLWASGAVHAALA